MLFLEEGFINEDCLADSDVAAWSFLESSSFVLALSLTRFEIGLLSVGGRLLNPFVFAGGFPLCVRELLLGADCASLCFLSSA